LSIGDRTVVEHILGRLAYHGISEVWINVHHHAQQFPEQLGDGTRYGVQIRYVHEARPLGTAGTPRLLRRHLGDEPLLVHYGDILTDHDLGALEATHARTGAWATMLTHQRCSANSYAFFDGGDRIRAFYQRPSKPPAGAERSWVFSGVSILSAACLDAIPDEPLVHLPAHVFPILAEVGRLCGQRLEGYRCAIDSRQQLSEARQAFEDGTFRPAPRRSL
jgi:NDP-sugar pyrophosphorylase family protein